MLIDQQLTVWQIGIILGDVGFVIGDVRRTTEVVTVIEEGFFFRCVVSLCNHIYTVRTVFVTSNLRPE